MRRAEGERGAFGVGQPTTTIGASSHDAPQRRYHQPTFTASKSSSIDGNVYYGGLSARVMAENTAAVGATIGPAIRGRVDATRGHPVVDVVDAQIFVNGPRAPDAVAVRCTLRGVFVVGISLKDISDVRRCDNGTALEVDFSAVEDSASVGILRRRHTLIVQSSRRDPAAVEQLYYAVVGAYRAALQGPTAAPAISFSSMSYDRPTMNDASSLDGLAAFEDERHRISTRLLEDHPHSAFLRTSSAELPVSAEWMFNRRQQHMDPHVMSSSVAGDSFDTPASIAAAAELARIQERRRERQRTLVGDIFSVNDNPNVSALSRGSVANLDLFASAAGGGGVAAADDEVLWCRWCNAFQRGRRHVTECDQRPVECSWCSKRMSHRRFEEHQFECRAMPNFQLAAEDERRKREDELRRKMRRLDRSAAKRRGDDDDDDKGDSDSDRSSSSAAARRRRRRRAEKQAAAERAAVEAKSAGEVARLAAAALEEEEFEKFGRKCVWCKKPKPKDHDPKCGLRRFICKACHVEVFLRDKDAHRLTCAKRPGRSAAEALGRSGRPSDTAAAKRRNIRSSNPYDDSGTSDDEIPKTSLASSRRASPKDGDGGAADTTDDDNINNTTSTTATSRSVRFNQPSAAGSSASSTAASKDALRRAPPAEL